MNGDKSSKHLPTSYISKITYPGNRNYCSYFSKIRKKITLIVIVIFSVPSQLTPELNDILLTPTYLKYLQFGQFPNGTADH